MWQGVWRAQMYRLVVLVVALGLMAGGLGAPVYSTPEEKEEALTVAGRVTPAEWQDALGVYSERWSLVVRMRYGEEVYDAWQGRASSAGRFSVLLRRDPARTDEVVEVYVRGGFLYGDRQLLIPTQELDPAAEVLDVGTIAMQRRR